MIAAAAYDATGGFSEAAVNACDAAVAVVFSTCRQHVPATGEMERKEELKIEAGKIGQD